MDKKPDWYVFLNLALKQPKLQREQTICWTFLDYSLYRVTKHLYHVVCFDQLHDAATSSFYTKIYIYIIFSKVYIYISLLPLLPSPFLRRSLLSQLSAGHFLSELGTAKKPSRSTFRVPGKRPKFRLQMAGWRCNHTEGHWNYWGGSWSMAIPGS